MIFFDFLLRMAKQTMKIIKYTLLGNGKVPESMVDGGYFPKPNGGQSPQDYDLIGYSLGGLV